MVYTAAVLFVIGLAWLLLQIKSVIIILILGIILAAAIEPFVQRLRRIDRLWQRTIRRRPYPNLLPGPVERHP